MTSAASSPSTALYVKNRNARDFLVSHPRAVEAIIRRHYMDDYLDSIGTEEQARKLISEVRHIQSRGGFQLGWASNNETVLADIPKDARAEGHVELNFDQTVERVLGLSWSPKEDTFKFDIRLKKIPDKIRNGVQRPTKRQMLRAIMSVFDPQGFLTPFTIQSRILLQDVWRNYIKWDDQLKNEEYNKWRNWISGLEHIK